jgi:hypothetical protein
MLLVRIRFIFLCKLLVNRGSNFIVTHACHLGIPPMKSPTPRVLVDTHTRTYTHLNGETMTYSAFCLGLLRATSHTSQQLKPCDCEGLWLSCKGHTTRNGIAICVGIDTVCRKLASYLPLGNMLDTNSGRPWNIIHRLPCRNLCRLSIHDKFFGALRP